METANIEEKLKKEITRLGSYKTSLCFLIKELQLEEQADNDTEVVGALQTVIRKQVGRLNDTLEQHKENVAHSLLDERKEAFQQAAIGLAEKLTAYKDYEDETWRKKLNRTLLLIDEGNGGFRTAFFSDTYYEDLLREERERYREENYRRLETIYQQDFADGAYDCPDETERKNRMVSECRKQFHATRFGREYHDQGRDNKLIAAHIMDQKEQGYKDIYEFFGKWLALEIAEARCREKHEQVYANHIFKDNVDIDKVMDKLTEYVKDGTMKSQRQWYVVFRVFEKKEWLKPPATQRAFRDQMNATFEKVLKCTDEDFRKVDGYFKRKKDYADWTLEDRDAPPCCEEYKRLAMMLDAEFKDTTYAKPGTVITTRNAEKFR